MNMKKEDIDKKKRKVYGHLATKPSCLQRNEVS